MILDTNGLSAMAEGDKELEVILATADELAIPAIVLGEYRYGIAASRSRPRYENWLRELLDACRVLAVDEDTAVEYSSLRRDLKQIGRPIPSNDLWIGALVRQHRMPIVSRDQHFDWIAGVRRVSW